MLIFSKRFYFKNGIILFKISQALSSHLNHFGQVINGNHRFSLNYQIYKIFDF